ncbi:MAG TPA: type II CAAX endopeptidase family protein [Acidimicrobiales bacterium]|nr:type II CAAX endopeptidase family protein [Acidimicrobiales bacterium]
MADDTATAPRVRDALLTWLVAFGVSNIIGGIVLGATHHLGADEPDPPIWMTALLQVPFWLVLVGGTVLFSRRKGTGDLGTDMRFHVEQRDAAVGLPAGILTQLIVVPLLYLPIFWLIGHKDLSDEAKHLTDQATGAGVVLLVLLVVIGAPIVEELFFRGFMMGALERTTRSKAWALWISAVFFGAVHFQPLQFPALVLFGLVAGWLVQRYERLGPSIFAHMGFNAVTVFILLVQR